MVELGEATVWHEGSQSFYRARLLTKMSAADVELETMAASGEDMSRVSVTYGHPADLQAAFRHPANIPIPQWAVNVKVHQPTDSTVYAGVRPHHE